MLISEYLEKQLHYEVRNISLVATHPKFTEM
uniref:Uncharacterized protein n=1 Tax=Arundo donax TaxID=35708 RepID=A0A0A9SDD4_ARUDO